MSLLSYQIVKTVVEQNSFQGAAEILHLTPSAISHAIANLEKQLGVALFIRNKTGIQLTGYGKNLLPYIQAILHSEESLQQEIASLNELEKGKVKIGLFNSICANWIPTIVNSFQKLHPNIAIELYEGNYEEMATWIKNGTVDIAFLSVSSTKQLEITPLYRDPLLCVTPKGFFPVEKKSVTIEDIRKQRFVYQREGSHADITNYLRKYNLTPLSTCYLLDDQSTITMVENGFGICIMPELVLRNQSYSVDIYPLEPSEYRIVGIAALNLRFLAPAVKKMFTHIVATCKTLT